MWSHSFRMNEWSLLRVRHRSSVRVTPRSDGGTESTRAPVQVAKVVRRVQPGKERPIEPPATLRNQVVKRVGDVLRVPGSSSAPCSSEGTMTEGGTYGLGRGAALVVQDPRRAALRDELPAEDAVLLSSARAEAGQLEDPRERR